MRDYLIDLVKHTVPVSAFTTLRVDGTKTETKIASTHTEKEMVLRGRFHRAIPEFKGTFGIPNLQLLNTLLSIPEYDNKASFTVVTRAIDDGVQPTNLHLENAAGDFKNDFRFMAANVIESVEPVLKFNVANWPVEFEPSVNGAAKLKYQTSAHPDEKTVLFKVENGVVTAQLGDVSSHSGNFVFQEGVSKSFSKKLVIPVAHINAVLALAGNKKFHMGELGVMISVDSGLGQYDYIIPALQK